MKLKVGFSKVSTQRRREDWRCVNATQHSITNERSAGQKDEAPRQHSSKPLSGKGGEGQKNRILWNFLEKKKKKNSTHKNTFSSEKFYGVLS